MSKDWEDLIRMSYKKWKYSRLAAGVAHPDEETLVNFLDKKLSSAEEGKLSAHILSCQRCAEAIAVQLKLASRELEENVPQELISWAKNLEIGHGVSQVLEIVLKLKARTFQIINISGDVLFGQELMPVPLLRSRKIRDFKDEITIFRDFDNVKVEIKVESKKDDSFDLVVIAREKLTHNVLKDVRITLIRDNVELESYISSGGKVVFQHVLLGKYKVEITNPQEGLAAILIDIKT